MINEMNDFDKLAALAVCTTSVNKKTAEIIAIPYFMPSCGVIDAAYYDIEGKFDISISVHNDIVPSDISGLATFRPESFSRTFADEKYLVCHHQNFHVPVLRNNGVDVDSYEWICTKRLCEKLEHYGLTSDSKALGTLKYFYNNEYKFTGDTVTERPFSVYSVLEVQVQILVGMGLVDVEEGIEGLKAFHDEPIIFETMPFGKHKGVEVSKLPMDYVRYLLRGDILNEESSDYNYDLAKTFVKNFL